MEELLPFLFFIAYILFSVFSSTNKKKKKAQGPLPPVVKQPKPKRQPQKPSSQTQPKTAKTQPKQILKRRNVPTVSKPQPKPISQKTVARQQQNKTPKTSRAPQKSKNPFETIFDEVLKELEVKKPQPRKEKPKPKLFKQKPKVKTTIAKKIEQQQVKKPVTVKKKRKIGKKLKTFDFDAVDAVIYSEIFKRKY